ncbi:FAD-dependent monooxygenase [Pseudonocardia acidicola]|uniref:Monooxygenase n=1 Tax=Pseudonocardia acidicola TaxID=2724939 RepID=A0ABX1SC52_9PSEU|nr:monooxygenase [Pseudonocardia acidicola]
MKIVCVGGGPAGLYFAMLAKLRSVRDDVAIVERNPLGATHGWGVTFGEDLLDDLYRNDPESARAIRSAAHLWAGQVVRIGAQPPVHLGGKYGYSMSRAHLLDIMAKRAMQLGVQVQFECEVADHSDLDADLIVAADGVGSRLRSSHADHFGTTMESGHNRYIWLGTSKVFDVFTFAFERTPAGWVWFYAYPSSGETSTCIVECAPATWTGLGLDRLDSSAGVRLLEEVFARALDGHGLIESVGGLGAAPWLTFRHVHNKTWHRDNLVLVGDAAHTTHFGIGSGTVLAVQDSIALAEALHGSDGGLATALPAYDRQRRAALEPVQEMARRSMEWFENIDARLDDDAVRFGYSLLDRRGDHSAWRYQLHLATQIDSVRRIRSGVTSARRSVRAARRAKLHPARPLKRASE